VIFIVSGFFVFRQCGVQEEGTVNEQRFVMVHVMLIYLIVTYHTDNIVTVRLILLY